MKRYNKREVSRFEPLEDSFPCVDPGHNPPSHMVIPYGQKYIHVCPACGKKQTIVPIQVSF